MRTIFLFVLFFAIASANRDHQRGSEHRTSQPFRDDVIYPNEDSNEPENQSDSYEYYDEDPNGPIYIDSGEDDDKLQYQPLYGFIGYRGLYGQGPYLYWTYGKPLTNTDSGENSGENSDENSDEDNDRDFVPYKYKNIRRFPEDDFVHYYGKRRPSVYGKNGKLMKTDSGKNSDKNSDKDNDRDTVTQRREKSFLNHLRPEHHRHTRNTNNKY